MARYRRVDVVDRAVGVLDERGLADLSMRHLAAALGVQPSALYHHFANKQALLGAVADRILELGRRATEIVPWESELRLVAVELRDAMLAHRDGAALIAQAHALGSAQEPERRMREALQRAGADADLARVGARTLLHFVLGHAIGEQAPPLGATPDPGDPGRTTGGTTGRTTADTTSEQDSGAPDFAVGIGLVLEGLSVAVQRRVRLSVSSVKHA